MEDIVDEDPVQPEEENNSPTDSSTLDTFARGVDYPSDFNPFCKNTTGQVEIGQILDAACWHYQLRDTIVKYIPYLPDRPGREWLWRPSTKGGPRRLSGRT